MATSEGTTNAGGARIFYYVGLLLLCVKAVTLIVLNTRGTIAIHDHAMRLALWVAGKVTPTLFCLSFLIDATIMKSRSRYFWAALTVLAFALTIAVVYFRFDPLGHRSVRSGSP